jgi:Invasion associated locus B (IalB) protein
MSVFLSRVAAATFGIWISVTCAYAQASPTVLGTFDFWEAYKSGSGADAVCWAVSQPQAKEPATAKRDPIYFMVTTWPKAKKVNEPSVVIGYKFKAAAEATIQVGSDKFNFLTKDDAAWLMDNAQEKRLVAAMRGASELTVKGMSLRGTLTTDTYSLKGLSSALDKIAEGCK